MKESQCQRLAGLVSKLRNEHGPSATKHPLTPNFVQEPTAPFPSSRIRRDHRFQIVAGIHRRLKTPAPFPFVAEL